MIKLHLLICFIFVTQRLKKQYNKTKQKSHLQRLHSQSAGNSMALVATPNGTRVFSVSQNWHQNAPYSSLPAEAAVSAPRLFPSGPFTGPAGSPYAGWPISPVPQHMHPMQTQQPWHSHVAPVQPLSPYLSPAPSQTYHMHGQTPQHHLNQRSATVASYQNAQMHNQLQLQYGAQPHAHAHAQLQLQQQQGQANLRQDVQAHAQSPVPPPQPSQLQVGYNGQPQSLSP